MTNQGKTYLKGRFATGVFSTGQDFADLIDSLQRQAVIDVRDFNPDNTGNVDATAAIQAATDAAIATGGVVQFEAGGKYLIDGTIDVPDGKGVTFRGQGYGPTGTLGSFLKKTTTGPMFLIDWDSPGSNDAVAFEDLTLYGGATATDSAHIGIKAIQAHGLSVNRCHISAFGGNGMYIKDGWTTKILFSSISACGLDGVRLFRQCHNSLLLGCAISGNCRDSTSGYANLNILGDTGHTYVHNDITILNCDFEGAGGNPFGSAPSSAMGLLVDDVYGLDVRGCHFESSIYRNVFFGSNVKYAEIGGGTYIQTQYLEITTGGEVEIGRVFFDGSGIVGEPVHNFYNVSPVARQVLATGAGKTVDEVITALQNLGLVKQS